MFFLMAHMCNTIHHINISKDINYFTSLIQVKFEDCLPSCFIYVLLISCCCFLELFLSGCQPQICSPLLLFRTLLILVTLDFFSTLYTSSIPVGQLFNKTYYYKKIYNMIIIHEKGCGPIDNMELLTLNIK
jgi:hypothetical protein